MFRFSFCVFLFGEYFPRFAHTFPTRGVN
jgi:hypothetical protein